MPITLTTSAIERATFAISASFTDDTGAPVTPNAGLVWSLYKHVAGIETVVNLRLNVAIASAATITVVLSDADLALVAGESNGRWLVLQGTYNSSLGTNLPLRDHIRFSIVNLVGVI